MQCEKNENAHIQKEMKCYKILGHLGGSAVEHLPLAQGMIPGSGIESHIGLLQRACFSLCLSLCLSLSLSLMNKILKKNKKTKTKTKNSFILELF